MRTSLLIHFDLLPSVELLSNAEAGKLFKAVLRYNVNGELPDNLNACGAVLFQQLKSQHDRDQRRYDEISQKRSEAAQAKRATVSGFSL